MVAGKTDPYDLSRFISAQQDIYADALGELKAGKKRSHWMWFVFPQIDGLGHSATTKHYAIKSLAEARAYLEHPLLGPRLMECTEAAMVVRGSTALEIFGTPDDMKFHSSMTLFDYIAKPGSVFSHAIDKYFSGSKDVATCRIIDDLGE